jgi:AAA15 family ATPase/GTPase
MSAFDFYQRKISSTVNTNSTGRNYPTLGEKLKSDSDMLVEATWSNDLQSKICYIYDYAHDNEPEKNKYMTYENTTKTRIDAKFIINSYGSIDKDQVAYHLMFKPSQQIDFVEGDELYYFETDYRKPLDIRFPVSLYCDIPDEKGVYCKWLICDFEESNQFMKYVVLPCDYRLQWISVENAQRVKRQMWCCTRSANSYTSGLFKMNTRIVRLFRKLRGCIPLNCWDSLKVDYATA